MNFGTCPTGWHIEGDLPYQVAVSTGSTVCGHSILFLQQSEFAKAETVEWTCDNRVAGQVRSGGGLTFAAVEEAGHMVPMDQPSAVSLLASQLTSRSTSQNPVNFHTPLNSFAESILKCFMHAIYNSIFPLLRL